MTTQTPEQIARVEPVAVAVRRWVRSYLPYIKFSDKKLEALADFISSREAEARASERQSAYAQGARDANDAAYSAVKAMAEKYDFAYGRLLNEAADEIASLPLPTMRETK